MEIPNADVARELVALRHMVRLASKIDLNAPLEALESAADRLGWQKIRVLRALEGRPLP